MNDNKNMSLSLVKDELNINEMVEIQGGSGQDVANCISDAYTNHGWISVALWVESTFIQETLVAVAADCTVHDLCS